MRSSLRSFHNLESACSWSPFLVDIYMLSPAAPYLLPSLLLYFKLSYHQLQKTDIHNKLCNKYLLLEVWGSGLQLQAGWLCPSCQFVWLTFFLPTLLSFLFSTHSVATADSQNANESQKNNNKNQSFQKIYTNKITTILKHKGGSNVVKNSQFLLKP